MEKSGLSDYEYACMLHKQLNGYDVEPPQSMSACGSRNLNSSVVSLSSDDENEFAVAPNPKPNPLIVVRTRSRSPLNVQRQVSIENQQAITIQRERKSRNDYYMPLMNTYIDMTLNQEWKTVNMESNIQQMFDKLQAHFFSKWLKNVKFNVLWDTTEIISDDSCFKIFENERKVLIKTSAMVQPRINLVSVLLHILIHLYLATNSAGAIKINTHDDNFRKIMLDMNTLLKTKISTFHKFIYSPEEAEYPQQWYQCTGICTTYEPFHGTVRSTSIPDESHSFFKDHDEICGGQFFRIFEMSRVNPENDNTEKLYVRNTNYMFPKPRAAGRNVRANQQVRELFDLTNDGEESARVQNLCDVINLDDTDHTQEAGGNDVLVNNITKQAYEIFCKCPFCTKPLGTFRHADHYDKCRGYQQKVVFKLKK